LKFVQATLAAGATPLLLFGGISVQRRTNQSVICMPLRLILALLLATGFLGGCASSMPSAAKEDRSPADPWEPMNRQISAFNETVDGLTFKPLAKGYEQVIPQVVRRGINNFSRNLIGPLNILNNLLQGKVQRGASETGRFFVNTTFGIGGLFNVGNALGFDVYREDFGQTLAVWGVADGPYVIVPILGPRTLRDAAMIPLNFAADPTFYIKDDSTRLGLYAVRAIDARAMLFTAEALIEDSFDRYLAIREAYLQNRQYLIYDGDPPVDDDFYDDFENYDEDY
jgi:phospholipid-binding lipoprotein MlaA